MTKCPDCKGSGQYSGFNVTTEPCSRCKGKGNLVEEVWDQLEEAIGECDDENINQPSSSTPLEMGDTVFVYDENWGWYNTTVNSIYDSGSGTKMVELKHAKHTLRIMYMDLIWNITKNRWEYEG
jgi:RecJ-like exonuclease